MENFWQLSLTRQAPTLSIRGRIIGFERPRVMGILNVTPDSFYSGSRVQEAAAAAGRAGEMLAEGADILDIGACSTRPGADPLSADEEIRRLDPALEEIRSRFPEAVISVDTYRADVARHCVERWRVDIINDIGGGSLDPAMFDTVAGLDTAYILMHTRGTPADMDSYTAYDDVVAEVLSDLAFKLDRLHQAGVRNVVVDPGFGFAKDLRQNYELLARLGLFHALGSPVLAALSRKRMVCAPLGLTPEEAGEATVALGMAALTRGVDILRVHDVRPAVQSARLFSLLREADSHCPAPEIHYH